MGNATILFFPLLHADSILGMPDLFGLSFLLVVSLVLFEYDIRTINWNNNWILIFSTLAAIISRRWYVFGIIGAYTGFAIASILYNIKDAKKVIINGVYTSVFLGIVIFIVLCPFFIHSLNSHYSIAYSAWKYGGALWEIRHQGMILGALISGLIVLGGIIGLSRKETRFSSTVAIIGFFSNNNNIYKNSKLHESPRTMLNANISIANIHCNSAYCFNSEKCFSENNWFRFFTYISC